MIRHDRRSFPLTWPMPARVGLELVLSAGLLAACVSAPVRRTEPPVKVSPPPTLDLQIQNQLGLAWTVNYMQVYVDGWLLWQGDVKPGHSSPGRFALRGGGDQEVYVRALASLQDGQGGYLGSTREVYPMRAGSQRLLVQLAPAKFSPSTFRIGLELQ